MWILCAILELPAKQPIQPSELSQIGQIGSAVKLVASKWPPGFWFFSIAIDADYSFYVKSIATYAPAFLRHNNSVLARVAGENHREQHLGLVFKSPLMTSWVRWVAKIDECYHQNKLGGCRKRHCPTNVCCKTRERIQRTAPGWKSYTHAILWFLPPCFMK